MQLNKVKSSSRCNCHNGASRQQWPLSDTYPSLRGCTYKVTATSSGPARERRGAISLSISPPTNIPSVQQQATSVGGYARSLSRYGVCPNPASRGSGMTAEADDALLAERRCLVDSALRRQRCTSHSHYIRCGFVQTLRLVACYLS